ncbi:uncharacterized protein N7515_008668 [Penicillium bovifimosum]|uniref:Something about silencing protein 4 domain-containing protein n=1 Tax=Penicillium bovifimosum TaxID=126998 RepID=A0A9W9GNQ6_9EURO|nr:uncharacterized protein N7515_008668 [Penicillium bovifimosum]KAJ5124843.1 hypothetical protein N7515_008668 [Penicillium bovifimosum]
MALLSRSSLRGSVRRAPEEPADGLAPPTKKQRIEENGPGHRKSSPDCLDSPAKDTPTANPHPDPPLKPSRSRTSTRRTRRASSASSVATVASTVGQLATPATRKTANGTVKIPRAHRDQNTSSATAGLLHESPDPLDTISPAPPSVAQKPRTATLDADVDADYKQALSPVIKRARRNDKPSLADDDDGKVVKGGIAVEVATPPRKSNRDVSNGEQSAPVETRTGRRSLRSADTGSRCKSELAQYFHNYEQIISLEEPEPELLAANTTITLVDDLPQPLPSPSTPTSFGNPLLNLHDCEKITLPESKPNPSGIDPLGEEVYFRAHRKFERQEKQLRNIERNRAQHEQQVLERLLEELRGHDWLRAMGLTGVHESDKKLYAPKRDILIQELVALVNKFQAWKDEDRRRKQAKDKPVPAGIDTDSRRQSRKRSRPAEDVDTSPAPTEFQNTPDPDPSDVDAWAARQLHEEARSAGAAKVRKTAPAARKSISKPTPPKTNTTKTKTKTSASEKEKPKPSPKRKKDQPPEPQTPSKAPAPKKNLQQASLSHFWNPAPQERDAPFTSFFCQRHVRDAAIAATNGIRRSGSRSALAFGHPVPDMEEREFELPPDILNEDSIQQSQRKRRRLRRGSRGN